MTSPVPQDAEQHDTPILRVYVAAHCSSCPESRRLAGAVTARLPRVTVELVDIDRDGAPDEIFAIPTFQYRGHSISLGNPSEDDLCWRIVEAERKATGLLLPVLDLLPELHGEERQRFPAQLRGNPVVAQTSGAAGLAGTLLCSASMIGVTGGSFAVHLHARAGFLAGLSNAPGLIAAAIRFGPEILILSVLLVIVSAAIREPRTVLLAVLGGSILYLGMYTQPITVVMYSAMLIGVVLLALTYVLVLRPDLVRGFEMLRPGSKSSTRAYEQGM